jgi:aminopeptidase YwaD
VPPVPLHKSRPASAPRPYAGLSLLWAAIVLVLTLTPSNEMPRTPVWELLSFDTAAHAGVFWVLAGLSWFSLHRQRRWLRLARHAGLAVLVASTAFGALIEALQMTMRLGRHGEWSDLLSDGLGAALAVALGTAWMHRAGRRARPVAPVCWAGLLLVGIQPQPVHAQDLARARRTIEKLAAPEMHGRGYVQQGEHKAAAYLRGRLQALKLEPLAPNYTQPFGLDVNTFPKNIQLSVVDIRQLWMLNWPDKKLDALAAFPFRAGSDFIAAPNSAGRSGHSWLRVLALADSTIFSGNTAAQQQLLHRPTHHAALLLSARDAARLPSLPPLLRQHLDSAVAWITLVPKLTASLAAEQAPQLRVELLTSVWQHYGGPARVAQPYVPMVRLDLDAQLQRSYPTQNLAAVVRGTAQPDSFLVVSAHYDHLGMMGKDVYFPGANDNASGVALLLELAAHYARPENRPACSVVFLLFGAEEAGLVGSSYFVAHPLVPLQRMKFLVNLDLLGTGEQGATVVNGRVFERPYKRLVALNEAHHYLPQLAPRGRAANSDHYPFSEAGVPAFFIYTRGGSTAYHDVNDQPAALSLAGFAGAFGLVRDFLNEEGAAPQTKKSR